MRCAWIQSPAIRLPLILILFAASCKSEVIQEFKPEPAASEMPLPTTDAPPAAANPADFAPAAAATSLSADASELKAAGVKVSWPEAAFTAGSISIDSVSKVTSER